MREKRILLIAFLFLMFTAAALSFGGSPAVTELCCGDVPPACPPYCPGPVVPPPPPGSM